MSFGTFTLGSTASREFEVWTCCLQGMLPSSWGRFPVSFKEMSQPSFFSRQLLTCDVICHIYLHLHCSLRDSGRELPSSIKAVPNMGQVPCEFWADWLGFSFLKEELRQGSFQPYPGQDGASSMAGSSGHDLAHLLTPTLLHRGW